MSKINYLENLEDVKAIEVVSPKVSDKYVPIYSSEVIEILSPEFKLIGGCQPMPKKSLHYVDLSNGTDTLRLYNSYDRSLALRLSYVTDIPVDLGVDRLIHIGQKAKDFTDVIKEFKPEIASAIVTAKKINAYLVDTKITTELAKQISDIIFKKTSTKKGFQSYTNFMDILIPKGISIKNYIIQSFAKYEAGDYTYMINGKKSSGLKKSSVFKKIKIEKQIMDLITEEYPEITI